MVSVVLPTYNEAENLPVLVDRLTKLLADVEHEIIVVDDNSPDGTWEIAAELAEASPRIRSIRRTTDRGLSSAVMAGMEIAQGRTLAVMDSDLQHDESVLPQMIQPILDGDADVALGSREAEGGSYGTWSKRRRLMSWGGAQMAKRALGVQVTDPMSGFFAISRDRYTETSHLVNPRGFKILLEFIARGPKPRIAEVGYGFRERTAGETKLSGGVISAYLVALIDLFVGRVVSATFTAYALVGSLGVLVRLAMLLVLTTAGYEHAALAAFQLSVVSNYLFNNGFTFADRRRRGWRLLSGFIPFQVIALHGLMVQIGLAAVADSSWTASLTSLEDTSLWLQVLGIAIATTSNFHLNRNVTWR